MSEFQDSQKYLIVDTDTNKRFFGTWSSEDQDYISLQGVYCFNLDEFTVSEVLTLISDNPYREIFAFEYKVPINRIVGRTDVTKHFQAIKSSLKARNEIRERNSKVPLWFRLKYYWSKVWNSGGLLETYGYDSVTGKILSSHTPADEWKEYQESKRRR